MVNIDWLRTKLMFFSIFRYIFKKIHMTLYNLLL